MDGCVSPSGLMLVSAAAFVLLMHQLHHKQASYSTCLFETADVIEESQAKQKDDDDE